MKKAILGIIVISLIASCSKTTPASQEGAWTINGATYNAASCTANSSNATLSATQGQAGSTYSSIVVYFHDSLPTVGGTYVVSQYGSPFGRDSLAVTVAYSTSDTDIYYASVDSGLHKATVSISPTGKIGVSVSKMYMVNTTYVSPDTFPLSFNIMQQ